jgi:hypothetical protein
VYGKPDRADELIARNQELLALAAETREVTRAAIVRAEASVRNVMQTRIRLELTR